jgi:hypothetical protein
VGRGIGGGMEMGKCGESWGGIVFGLDKRIFVGEQVEFWRNLVKIDGKIREIQ